MFLYLPEFLGEIKQMFEKAGVELATQYSNTAYFLIVRVPLSQNMIFYFGKNNALRIQRFTKQNHIKLAPGVKSKHLFIYMYFLRQNIVCIQNILSLLVNKVPFEIYKKKAMGSDNCS